MYFGGERRRCSVRLALEHDVTGKVTPSDVVKFLHTEGECEEGAIKCVQTDKDGDCDFRKSRLRGTNTEVRDDNDEWIPCGCNKC